VQGDGSERRTTRLAFTGERLFFSGLLASVRPRTDAYGIGGTGVAGPGAGAGVVPGSSTTLAVGAPGMPGGGGAPGGRGAIGVPGAPSAGPYSMSLGTPLWNSCHSDLMYESWPVFWLPSGFTGGTYGAWPGTCAGAGPLEIGP
jgi:hypothetical protein